MTDFITVNNLSERSNGGKKNTVVKIAAAVFWIAVWQIVSMAVGYSILLPSPFEVVQKLIEILPRSEFVSDVAFSFVRIIGGFFCAAFAGTVFAVLSYNFGTVKILLMPLVSLVKTVPVASFVVIALIWLPSRNLSFLISSLMVLPIMYSNILSGIYAVDDKCVSLHIFAAAFQIFQSCVRVGTRTLLESRSSGGAYRNSARIFGRKSVLCKGVFSDIGTSCVDGDNRACERVV